jgi:hypothetical protein
VGVVSVRGASSEIWHYVRVGGGFERHRSALCGAQPDVMGWPWLRLGDRSDEVYCVPCLEAEVVLSPAWTWRAESGEDMPF